MNITPEHLSNNHLVAALSHCLQAPDYYMHNISPRQLVVDYRYSSVTDSRLGLKKVQLDVEFMAHVQLSEHFSLHTLSIGISNSISPVSIYDCEASLIDEHNIPRVLHISYNDPVDQSSRNKLVIEQVQPESTTCYVPHYPFRSHVYGETDIPILPITESILQFAVDELQKASKFAASAA